MGLASTAVAALAALALQQPAGVQPERVTFHALEHASQEPRRELPLLR